MKQETAAFLEKSREFLKKAQALIFEQLGRTFKTHTGVQSEFAKLVKDDPRFNVEHRRFLGRAYNLKAVADYEAGPGSHVTADQAQAAIERRAAL